MLQEILVIVAFLCLVVAVVGGFLQGMRDRDKLSSKDWLNNPVMFDRSVELSGPASWSSHRPTMSGQSFHTHRRTASSRNSEHG